MKNAAVVVACVFVFLWKYWSLNLDYEREQAVHIQTQTKLTAALSEARNWRMVAGENLLAAESQKQLAESCLAREEQAREDATARKAILTTAKPRPRTVAEKQQVVDDETRARAVSRLNREL